MSAEGRKWRRLWIPAILSLLLLGGEIYLFSHDTLAPRRSSAAQARLATLKLTRNEVLHKNEGTLLWQSPAAGSDLYPEDAIATRAEAEAVVSFADGSELVVEPDSLVVLEMAPVPGSAPGTPIVARLLRGSMKRKAGKAASKLLVKLSGQPDAEAVELDDTRGSAVFRMIHDTQGLRIIIEGGTVTVNGGRALGPDDSATVALREKLPPPRLKKPSVETKLRPGEPSPRDDSGFLRKLELLLFPEAWADEPPSPELDVRIEFRWEPVPQARGYVIQIARDPAFRDLALEKSVQGTEFVYRFESPNERAEFFFRAAAVSEEGVPGAYSTAQRVEVLPRKAPSARVAERKKKEKAKPAKKPAPQKPAEEPGEVAIPAEELRKAFHGEAALGGVFHRRQFKNETGLPKTATGTGFVPTNLRAEGWLVLGDAQAAGFGGSYLFEVGRPKDQGAELEKLKLGTPLWRAWAVWGVRSGSLLAALGPYATSTSEVRLSGLSVTSQGKMLAGALARLAPHPDSVVALHWSLQVAALVAGTKGADVALSLRQPLRALGSLEGFRLSGERDFFWGLELQGRFSGVESSQGGMLELGRFL